ncbi:hypothetical protein JSO61_000435 [Riemerella anatipestifer]|uniref:hypothetical protein n=1 Tax=Bergeyella anatis TaxID=3113737 RepID=UPI002E16F592|nr:hypothetical protein [Bergeyella sp. RCAD1439]
MKKILFLLSIILGGISFGQIKKIPVTAEEIGVLGRLIHGSVYNNSFTKEEFGKYNIANTLGYYAEYVYQDKVIHKEVFKLRKLVLSGKAEFQVYFDSTPCFKVSELTSDVSLNLMKDNHWEIKPTVDGDYICYYGGWTSTNGISIIESKEYKKYNVLSLADGKIKIKLYRLEEE